MSDTAAVAAAVEIFEHVRAPDPAWVEALRAISPVEEHVAHLRLVWHAGSPESPQQRWVVYEMLPLTLARQVAAMEPGGKIAVLLEECDGPHPYTLPEGHTLLTGTQWELYRETGCLGAPFWVIQGSTGGHKVRFTPTERKWLRMAKLPADPPVIGTLPYAPFDQRVIRQLQRHDRLEQVGGSLHRHRQASTAQGHTRQMKDAEREFRQQYVSWLGEQVGEEAEEMARVISWDRSLDIERVDRDLGAEAEESEHRWVETGRL